MSFRVDLGCSETSYFPLWSWIIQSLDLFLSIFHSSAILLSWFLWSWWDHGLVVAQFSHPKSFWPWIHPCACRWPNFPLWVQLMLCPFPIISDPFMGTKLYTPNLWLVIWLVAAESPMKMFSPRFDSAISFVNRAFSFSPFFLEYCDGIHGYSIFSRLAHFPSFFSSILL